MTTTDTRRIVAEYCPGCGETHYPQKTGAAEYCRTCQYYGRDRATGGGPATTTRTPVNLDHARRNADAVRARFSDPQDDPLAFALSRNALDLADEVEQLLAKRDAYRDSALMYAARVAELNDEIAELRAAQREETDTEDCHRCRHWTPAQRKWHHCIHCDGTGQVPAQQEENTR